MSVCSDLATLIEAVSVHYREGGSLQSAVKKLGSDANSVTFEEFFVGLMKMIELSEQELCEAVIPEESRRVMLNRHQKHQRQLISFVRAADSKTAFQNIDINELADDFRMFHGATDGRLIDEFAPNDIDEMLKTARRLVTEVKSKQIDKIAEQAILLNLNSMIRIYSEYEIFGELDMKQRIKSALRDLNENWEKICKKDESTAEKLKAWIGKQLKRGVATAEYIEAGETIGGLIESATA